MATVAPSRFAPYHRRDRAFFLAFVAVAWLGVLFGFFPASAGRIMGRADYVAPVILHVHAASFVGWLSLLTAQVLLVQQRRMDIHMRLGVLTALLIPVMAYSGIAAELFSQRFYLQQSDRGLGFFILPIFYVVAFTGFAVAAVLYARRDAAMHKRLILMATTVIVGAAYARWWGGALNEWVADPYWGTIVRHFTGTNLILAAAFAFDLVTRGRPHRAYRVGIPLILAGQLICSWIYHASWWPPVARSLIAVDLPLVG